MAGRTTSKTMVGGSPGARLRRSGGSSGAGAHSAVFHGGLHSLRLGGSRGSHLRRVLGRSFTRMSSESARSSVTY